MKMYVYPLVRTYSTGTSYVERVFSSERRAKAYLDEMLKEEEKHGWLITRSWSHDHRSGYPIHRMEKGAPHNAEMWHYEKHEVT